MGNLFYNLFSPPSLTQTFYNLSQSFKYSFFEQRTLNLSSPFFFLFFSFFLLLHAQSSFKLPIFGGHGQNEGASPPIIAGRLWFLLRPPKRLLLVATNIADSCRFNPLFSDVVCIWSACPTTLVNPNRFNRSTKFIFSCPKSAWFRVGFKPYIS